MSQYDDCLRLEETYGPPETREPGPSDEDQRGVMLPPRDTVLPTHTFDEWREIKIAEGYCPKPGCYGKLDESFCCAGCGRVSLPATVEVGAGSSSGLSEALCQPELVEEYAPAAIDEEAA